MNKLTISLKKLNAVVLEATQPITGKHKASQALVLTVNAKLMALGFIMSEALFQELKGWKTKAVIGFANDMLPVLNELKGSHVKHRPMYPNFPKQVMETSEAELYVNAMLHYFSHGYWQPEYPELPRQFAFEQTKFQEIGVVDDAAFRGVFTTLLASRDSLSPEDKAIVRWFLAQDDADQLRVPDVMPFHENKCLLAAHWLEQGRDISPLVKTATDVLRIATYMADGDVSLADNTRFKSLARPVRRVLVKQLERVINEEDIGRHRNKWVRLFHNLHVGDYSDKVFRIAKKARNGLALESFYSHLEAAMQAKDMELIISLLSSRPGEFGRRLDHALRVAADVDAAEKPGKVKTLVSFKALRKHNHWQKTVVQAFLEVMDNIPVRNLLQLHGHLNSRAEDSFERIVFPKGSLQKAVVIPQPLAALDAGSLLSVQEGIRASLMGRFAPLDSLGKTWISPDLIDCPLPAQQRSTSAGLHNMARGTRLPIAGDKSTIRLFVYWKGMDIDLSATFHDEGGQMLEHVSYTNLKSGKYRAYHSGDITRAPNGASEFIDIDIASAAKHARYLAMNVLVFNGPSFAEHETCFVGWMTRSRPNSNEVYEPATVEQKVDLTSTCRNLMPVVFDLQERKVVWTDLPVSRNGFHVNNVENTQASVQQKLNAILGVRNKLSLYELFELHAAARGELVETPEDADTVFALDQGVTPFDVNTINAEFMG